MRTVLAIALAVAASCGKSAKSKAPPELPPGEFANKVVALHLLPAGRSIVVTEQEVIEVAADGTRKAFVPENCHSIDAASFSADGTWIGLTCVMTADAGIWRVGDPKRAVVMQSAGTGTFCAGWYYSSHYADDLERVSIGTWKHEPRDSSGGSQVCLGDRVLFTAKGTQYTATATTPGEHTGSLKGPVIGRDAVVTYGYPESLGIVDLKGEKSTGPKVGSTPDQAARIGETWLVLSDRTLRMLPGGPTFPADGFVIAPDGKSVWVWHEKTAHAIAWTPPPPPPPRKPVDAILLSKPTRILAASDESVLALFEEPTLRAYILFVPSGDDLYGYTLVVSDTRGGSERINSEACEHAATKFREYAIGDGVTHDPTACASPRRNVIASHASLNPPAWLRFVPRTYKGMKVVNAEMGDYGESTELWLWRWSDAKGEHDATSWGAPPALELPGEP